MAAEPKKTTDIVTEVVARLTAEASSEQVRTKIRLLDAACRQVVIKDRRRLTVPGVVYAFKDLARGTGLTLAEPSIRNRREGRNPLSELYRAWSAVSDAALKEIRPRRASPRPSDEVLGEDDLSRIDDVSTRALVRLVLAENRNLRAERSILRQVRGAPTIKVVAAMDPDVFGGPLPPAETTLNEAEIDAVRDFIALGSLRERGLRRAPDGAIETSDGRALSDPGFVDALARIIERHAN